jgi:hypothetical protein
MTISKVIENITETQNPNWVGNLSDEEVEEIEKRIWLIWMKLKSIKEMEVIQPLLKISEYLTVRKILEGKLIPKNRKVDFKGFYSICIHEIPKRKYTFIYPKKIKKKEYDYQFLKLLAKDLGESIHHCEDYYDTLEQVGLLEKEKIELFKKYGDYYEPQSKDKIEIIDINSINLHPKRNINNSKNKEYLILLEKIKSFGLLEPIILDKKTNNIVSGYNSYQCCKELNIKRIEVIKREFKSDVLDIINFQPDNSVLISGQVKGYRELKQEILSHGYKDRKIFMGGLSMRAYLFKYTGISQTQNSRMQYIEGANLEIYKKVLRGLI